MVGLPQLVPPFKSVPFDYDQNLEKNAYSAGVETIAKLNKGPVLWAVDCMLKGRITTDGTPAGTRRPHNPYELAKQVRLSVPGMDLYNCSGLAAYILQNLRSKQPQYFDTLSAAEIAAVSTATDFEARLLLHLMEPFVEPEHAGVLPTALYPEGACQLGVTWGINTDLADSADFTLSLVENLVGLNGILPDRVESTGYGVMRHVAVKPNDLSTSNPQFNINLGNAVQGNTIHWLIIITRQGATRALSNAVLDQDQLVIVYSGKDVIFKRTVRQLRAITRALLPGLEAYDGIHVIPFVRKEGDNGGMAISTAAPTMSRNLQNYVQVPLLGAATNEIEVIPAVYQNPAKTLASQGLG